MVQINTGTGCHLDAHMVAHGVERLAPPRGSVLLIENVGNLVCPALFDLGEQARVVMVSVTEGDDKPLKYPHMFRAAELLLINKIDLLPYVRFDMDRCIASARDINPSAQVLLRVGRNRRRHAGLVRLADQAPRARRGGGMRLVPLVCAAGRLQHRGLALGLVGIWITARSCWPSHSSPGCSACATRSMPTISPRSTTRCAS